MSEIILWISVLVGAIVAFFGGHLLITKILPRLTELVNPIFKNDKLSHSFTFMLVIFIFVLVVRKIVLLLVEMNNPYLNVVSVLNPGLEVILEFVPYVQWVFVAIIIAHALKNN
ncbi:MAG: hypothetical protein PHG05_04495 [Candidatus Nanoarchaeia archaeon]|nr:hypothetical protein [Candidatus Nanoarchaeia archaeon]